MISLTLQFKPKHWFIEFSISPFRWYLKPWKLGDWFNSDWDRMTEFDVNYMWLCFSLKITKYMDMTQFLSSSRKVGEDDEMEMPEV